MQATDKKLPSLLHDIFNSNSRKVAFGWWLFLTAGYFLVHGKIDAEQWLICAGGAGTLIGGGTVADKWLKNKNDAAAASPAQEVAK